MKSSLYLPLAERARNYKNVYPNYPPLVFSHGWLYGVWDIGRHYKSSGYYGAYPPGFLQRVKTLYPDAMRILHLFSGSLTKAVPPLGSQIIRLDINPELEPDIIGDAHQLSSLVPLPQDLIIADPPYSEEDARHYGYPLVKRNTVVRECVKVLARGGHLVWLDQVRPQYRKKDWNAIGEIGVALGTNRRVRMIFILEKKRERNGREGKYPAQSI